MRYLFIAILLCVSSVSSAEILRAIYDINGKIKVIVPCKPNHTTADFDSVMEKDPTIKGLPYEDMDRSNFPVNKQTGCFIDQKYWVGKKGEGIKIDEEKKKADIEASEAKEKALNDKLKAIGITREELKEIIK